MFEIIEKLKSGACKGSTVSGTDNVIKKLSSLKHEAIVKQNGKIVGRCWKKDNGHWNYYLDQTV